MKKLAWNATFIKLRSWHLVSSLHGKWKGKKVETMANFIFLDSKITADRDCDSEIKKMLAPWKESYDKIRQRIKNQRHHLANKGPYTKSYGFSVICRCESWTIKTAEYLKIDGFKLWYWRRLLSLWTARRSNKSVLWKINPEYSLEELMLKLKLWYFGHLMKRGNSSEKTLTVGKIEGKRKRGQQRMRWLYSITY